jgi:hypothetical protein
MGIGAFYQREEWPERETNHSSPSSSKAKNAYSFVSAPLYEIVVQCLGKGITLISTFKNNNSKVFCVSISSSL